jgi:hypothetical protein
MNTEPIQHRLPEGMTYNARYGILTGTPEETGRFRVYRPVDWDPEERTLMVFEIEVSHD